jgi:hypothetical protein
MSSPVAAGIGALFAWVLVTADVGAGSVARVEITMRGPRAVRVRVAQGTTFPCDSAENRMLLDGKFGPGEIVRTATVDNCVCIQQTYESFADVDWSHGYLACRPVICTGFGRARRCVPAPDPTIRIDIHSKRVD